MTLVQVGPFAAMCYLMIPTCIVGFALRVADLDGQKWVGPLSELLHGRDRMAAGFHIMQRAHEMILPQVLQEQEVLHDHTPESAAEANLLLGTWEVRLGFPGGLLVEQLTIEERSDEAAKRRSGVFGGQSSSGGIVQVLVHREGPVGFCVSSTDWPISRIWLALAWRTPHGLEGIVLDNTDRIQSGRFEARQLTRTAATPRVILSASSLPFEEPQAAQIESAEEERPRKRARLLAE